MENVRKKHIQKNTLVIILLCCLGYFVSYLTRKNFSTAIAGIVEQTEFSKSQLGIVETALLISYGVSQIVTGFLADKFKPQNVVMSGLIITTACNAVFPLFNSIAAFAVVWAINGIGQSMFWPAMVRIIAEYLSPVQYKWSCSLISTASQVATILLYLLVPFVLDTIGYRWVFYIPAIVAGVTAVVWIVFYNINVKRCKKYEIERPASEGKVDTGEQKQKVRLAPIMISCGIITILFAIILQGCLRDGITAWIPSLVAASGAENASGAILKSVLLPVFTIIITYVGTYLYFKLFKNELIATAIFFSLSAVCILALFILNYANPDGLSIAKIIAAAIAVGLMHCTNLALISYIPAHFGKYNAVAFMSGLTNAFTYVGSAISTWGTALVAESFGWNAVVLVWLAIALLGIVVALVTIRPWGKFLKKEYEN